MCCVYYARIIAVSFSFSFLFGGQSLCGGGLVGVGGKAALPPSVVGKRCVVGEAVMMLLLL